RYLESGGPLRASHIKPPTPFWNGFFVTDGYSDGEGIDAICERFRKLAAKRFRLGKVESSLARVLCIVVLRFAQNPAFHSKPKRRADGKNDPENCRAAFIQSMPQLHPEDAR